MQDYKIEGTIMGGKQFIRYVSASGSLEATKKLMAAMDNVASWTIDLIQEDPEESTISCPHCGEKVRNPQLWLS